jgi:hypothetical protein
MTNTHIEIDVCGIAPLHATHALAALDMNYNKHDALCMK